MNDTTRNKAQVAVIGGGPAGYGAAFLAADLGLDIVLIDPAENPGGVCLYRGCIPSKALLHTARLLAEVQEAKDRGLAFGAPRVNIRKLRSWKDGVVDKLTGGLGQLVKQRKFRHLRGHARFVDPHTLSIREVAGAEYTFAFEHAVIATGSYPATLGPQQPDSPRLLDSTSALELADIPGTLLVIGGGYIGLEIGTIYAALGSRVSLVEMTDGLLPGVDRDLVAILRRRLDRIFDAVMLETTVRELKVQANGVKVAFAGKQAAGKAQLFDRVLVAIGRKPMSAQLGLDAVGVDTDARGFIKVDAQRRTSAPRIFAVGDVAGEPMLAHKGLHEGRVAAEVIAGRKAAFDPAAIPAVVFTDPEVAWAGLTETEAAGKKIEVEITRFPWAASGRALTLGRTDGATKLVIDPHSQRLLGMGVVGPGAGELIAEGVLAIEMAATVDDLGLSIHPHPTLSETVMEAADLFHGTATDYYRPKKRK